MAETVIFLLILAAVLGCGTMTGLFFAFSNSVMPALGRRPPSEGIAAMQTINVVILNPLFFVIFFGTALVSVALVTAAFFSWDDGTAAWQLAGGLLYLVGSIGVTVVCNVPRNNALLAAKADSSDGAALWVRYLREWTAWNHVRAIACAVATVAFVMALA